MCWVNQHFIGYFLYFSAVLKRNLALFPGMPGWMLWSEAKM